MTILLELQNLSGAVRDDPGAPPLHYGDPAAEYAAAKNAAILIDLSGEGRLELTDRDRLAILHRLSTNDVENLPVGAGRATILTTPIGRIIDRVIVHPLSGERVLLRTGQGRVGVVADHLRRNVFFRDKLKIQDVTASLAQFALYGPEAGSIAAAFASGVESLPLHHTLEGTFEDLPLIAAGLDPLAVPGIALIAPAEIGPALWRAIVDRGVRPAGSIVAEALRVEAGMPGLDELHQDYIPLEAGLWSDVSFSKGCYVGQEIIARMESRGKLAKTLVGVTLSGPAPAGSTWSAGGRKQGELTSVVQVPDGGWIGLGFVKPETAQIGGALTFDGGGVATIVLLSPDRL